MTFRFLIIFGLGVFLAACGEPSATRSEEVAAAIAERAAELRPDDFVLAQTYDRSCRMCHGVEGTGAPLTGDGEAWAPRLAQGNRAMMDHTIRGFNGMPPLGMCPDCELQDFRDLITFMSTDASE